ncbi:unnamed protein product [Sympodiomycopsis kandeliae]
MIHDDQTTRSYETDLLPNTTSTHTRIIMPVGSVPVITGKLRKRLILDLSVALGGGTALAYAYWYGVHVPSVQRRDNYYAKLQQQQKEAN